MIIAILLLGAVLGSYSACTVIRYTQNLPILTARSQCLFCGNKLKWWHLIPLVSFILLRGKCWYCEKKLLLAYPFIELLNSILLVLLYNVYGISIQFVYYLVIYQLLFITVLIDFYNYVLLDSITFFLFVYGIGIGFYINELTYTSLYSSLIVGGIALALFAYYYYIRKKYALGLGDIKLLFLLGLFINLKDMPYLFLYSSLAGIFYYLLLYLNNKNSTMQEAIPFGPFLFLGFILVNLF